MYKIKVSIISIFLLFTLVPNPLYATEQVTIIDVTQYGADGNDQVNDTTAIQNAIDEAAVNAPAVVFIPDGNYYIDTLTSLHLRSNLTLRLSQQAVLRSIPNAEGRYYMFKIHNIDNLVIEGGTLIGDRYEHNGVDGQWGYGIAVDSSHNITIRNVTAKDFWGDGFLVGSDLTGESNRDNENIHFDNVVSENNRRQGLSIITGKNILVENSLFSMTNGHAPQSGIDVEPDSSNQVLENIVIRNNRFFGNSSHGITTYYARDVKILNNSMIGNGHSGIRLLKSKEIIISGNHMSENKLWGFYMSETSNSNIINNDWSQQLYPYHVSDPSNHDNIIDYLGHIDNLDYDIVEDNFELKGWFLSDGGIQQLDVLVNGQTVGQAVYGIPRDDVFSMYPQFNDPNSGFSFQVDTSTWNEGVHKIKVRANNNNVSGLTKELTVFKGNNYQQLAINPSFENGVNNSNLPSGWARYAPVGTSAEMKVVEGTSGNKQFVISANSLSAGYAVMLHQDIAVQPGTPINVLGNIRARQLLNAKMQLYLEYFDAENKKLGYATTRNDITQVSDQFKLNEMNSQVPANAVKAKVSFILVATANGGSGVIEADAIEVYGVQVKPDVEMEQLAVNPSFESGLNNSNLPSGWTKYAPGGALVEMKVVEGTSGNKQFVISANSLSAGYAVMLHQDITVQPGTPINVLGNIRARQLLNAKMQLYLEFFDAENKRLGYATTRNDVTQESDQFKLNEMNSQVPANAVKAKVSFILVATANGGSGVIEADAIEVYGISVN